MLCVRKSAHRAGVDAQTGCPSVKNVRPAQRVGRCSERRRATVKPGDPSRATKTENGFSKDPRRKSLFKKTWTFHKNKEFYKIHKPDFHDAPNRWACFENGFSRCSETLGVCRKLGHAVVRVVPRGQVYESRHGLLPLRQSARHATSIELSSGKVKTNQALCASPAAKCAKKRPHPLCFERGSHDKKTRFAFPAAKCKNCDVYRALQRQRHL